MHSESGDGDRSGDFLVVIELRNVLCGSVTTGATRLVFALIVVAYLFFVG